MLGALLKQAIVELEGVPGEATYYKDQKRKIGEQEQWLDMVKMLETATSERPPFIRGDGFDEFVAEHRIKLLNSLDSIPRVLVYWWLGDSTHRT